MKRGVLIGILLLMLVPIVLAYCPPFFAKIEDIKNAPECLIIKATRGCGGEVYIASHCLGKFYFYDKQGNLDKNLILINKEEYDKNYQQYQELEAKTGKVYTGSEYLHEQPSFWPDDCYNWSEIDPYKNELKIIINNIDMCNRSEMEKAEDGTVVKNWSIKLFYEEQNQDITINGKTVYEKPLNLFLLAALISLGTTILCFFLRKKAEAFKILFWLFLCFTLFFFFSVWIQTRIYCC